MHRRSFLKAGSAVALAAGFRTEPLWAHVSTHNFDKYDFGAGPPVSDCGQKLNDDGSLTLRPNTGLGQNDEAGGVSPT